MVYTVQYCNVMKLLPILGSKLTLRDLLSFLRSCSLFLWSSCASFSCTAPKSKHAVLLITVEWSRLLSYFKILLVSKQQNWVVVLMHKFVCSDLSTRWTDMYLYLYHISLSKRLIFHNDTTVSVKWCLRNKHRDSILMKYPVMRHQYGISALVSQMSIHRETKVASWNVSCFSG